MGIFCLPLLRKLFTFPVCAPFTWLFQRAVNWLWEEENVLLSVTLWKLNISSFSSPYLINSPWMSFHQQLQLWSRAAFSRYSPTGWEWEFWKRLYLSVRSNCPTSFTAHRGIHFVPERCRSLQMQSIRFCEALYTFYGSFYIYIELRRAFMPSPFHIRAHSKNISQREIYIFFHFNPLSLASPPNSALSPRQAARWRSRFLHCWILKGYSARTQKILFVKLFRKAPNQCVCATSERKKGNFLFSDSTKVFLELLFLFSALVPLLFVHTADAIWRFWQSASLFPPPGRQLLWQNPEKHHFLVNYFAHRVNTEQNAALDHIISTVNSQTQVR